eukprot:TRINITY_DN3536_c0_g1_i1.p1 TRINITY_DN3536_c0_g1~~TRINITY_DN3536_c0_g1_i1.p1  ORF type:complete len:238 (-),score=26.40 TRINITY_DN3536_c0_g1_i1:72-785(-)
MTRLNLQANRLSGPIPASIQFASNLTGLHLGVNNFSGNIPSSIGNLQYLTELSLSDNQLTGPIPKELALLPRLSKLDLARNQLSGNLPVTWSTSTLSLNYLSLKCNNFSGTIPEIFSRFKFALFSLQVNNFNSPLPAWLLDTPQNANNVNISCNSFSTIPSWCDRRVSTNVARGSDCQPWCEGGKSCQESLELGYPSSSMPPWNNGDDPYDETDYIVGGPSSAGCKLTSWYNYVVSN